VGSDSGGLVGSDSGGLVGSDSGGLVGSDSGGLVGSDSGGLVGSDSGGLVCSAFGFGPGDPGSISCLRVTLCLLPRCNRVAILMKKAAYSVPPI